ncbi:VWA domain-containing protein [Treponema sp. OMZ 855]|uniref:VWA domain-containing protein n=1 Tax=Treponema sp. OMZ 855 TaxID=1643512 RepID=UPI0020A31BE9|nr:VWA domain-containing protein [Treponema sp. OMZ 855]UTC51605.1 VWA domain-containing protein [Treponema sp. OMZ 855]
MKKIRIFAVVAIFCLITSALSAQTTRQETADVIVLMDTSGTVLPYYEVINKRVLQSIISKFVRIGDSFHLISFSAVPHYEMSQKITTEADLSRVVSRFMLLYQLGQSADFLSGINFAGQYMTQLPSQQAKILIVISDGIFNPPASSPYRNYTGEQVKTELAKISASIRAHGWKVYYVKLPFPSDAVIKDLDGAFYAGKLDATGSLDRSGVDSAVTSSGTASAGTGSASSGQKGYAADTGTNAQNKAAGSAGQTAGNSAQTPNTATGRVNTETGRTDSPAAAFSGSNTAQGSGTDAFTTANSNSATGNDGYTQNQAGTTDSSGMTGQNTEHTAASAAGGQGTGTGTDSAGQGLKEYTDVSQAFTENLGIEPSNLPEEGGVEFNDTAFPIPHIIFPERIETSGNTAELPLTIINEAAEPAEVQLQSVSLTAGSGTQKQRLENIIVRIPPEGKSELTIRVSLPDSLRSEGQHRTDIRLDLAQQDKTFSQAAAVLLTVKPTFIQSLLQGNLLWILLAALVFILILLLIIFILRRRASEPVKYAARMVGQQSDLRQQNNAVRQTDLNRNQREALTASQTKYYPEQLANKTDPRDTLNSFGSQTAAAASATKTETAAQFDHLAQERSRAAEGRFALLNSAESHINHRPGLNHSYYSGRLNTKPSQSGMTELFVYNQTTLIGKRNIHVMKSGTRLSIGGSKSDDFLIFLVPFPANLAQVQYDGSDYRVSILKPEYFPYETSNTIYPCIGRDITAVSKKGYHVTFTFRGYEDPMVRLNTLLTSINYTEDR